MSDNWPSVNQAVTNPVIVDGWSSETVDGVPAYLLKTKWQYVRLQANGRDSWYVTGVG